MSADNNKMISINNIDNLQSSAKALMKTGHYRKLGEAGIFAVLQMAQSLDIDPFLALNGALYPVDGKIEMDGQMMMALIRQAGHSVTKDRRSTATHCILHGKRHDTGDTWTEEFSIEDAKKAGLLSRGTYQKYGRDMFQWRALSRLARFLFPDVIKRCYAMGEISMAPSINEEVDIELEEKYATLIDGSNEQIAMTPSSITEEQFNEIDSLIGDDWGYRAQLLDYLKKHYEIDSLKKLPVDLYERVKSRATKCWEARQLIPKEA